jgi:hypothetical protein
MTASPGASPSTPTPSIPEFTERHKFDPPEYSLVPHDYALTTTVPFTYRDGFTYLQVIEELRKWVNEGLRNALNSSLESYAADYNERISKLLENVRDQVGQYGDLPEQMIEQFRKYVADINDDLALFKESMREYVDRHLQHDYVEVFDWLTGTRRSLEAMLFDFDNRVLVNGLLAADFSRAGLTVEDIDSLPLDILEMQTQGKIFLDYWSREMMFSPVTGQRKHVVNVVMDVYESTFRGSASLATKSLDEISSASIADIQNCVCG